MTLANALRDLGCSVHIISKGSKHDSTIRDGLWIHEVAPQRPADVFGIGPENPITSDILDHSAAVCARVLEIAARYGVDIVETSSWDCEGLVTILDSRIPVVVRLVTPLVKVMETQRWSETPDLKLACDLERQTLLRAAGVIFSTNSMRKLVGDCFAIEPARSASIPFGLKIPALEPSRNGHQAKKVLFVGRLETRKGIHVLLDAIPGVLRSVPNAQFQIVGKDVLTGSASLADEWKRSHPEYRDRVEFCGEVPDKELSRYYEQCDLLVAPSLYESFGLIYVEAMARGKAVVGTTVGGIPEVVSHGITGLLVPPEDAGQLESAVTRLLSDDGLRTNLAQAGYRRYFEGFSAVAMAERTMEFYLDTIRDWNDSRPPVWVGDFSSSHQGQGVRVAWDPAGQHCNLVAEIGAERVIAYGPYITLDPGSYRAEFAVWSNGPLDSQEFIGKIEVFAGRILAERRILGRDLGFSAAKALDLFFSIGDRGEGQVEFRVITSGSRELRLRKIFVSRFENL